MTKELGLLKPFFGKRCACGSVYDDESEPVDFDRGLRVVLDTSPQIEDVLFFDVRNGLAYAFNMACLAGRDDERAKPIDKLGMKLKPPPKRRGPVTRLHSNNDPYGMGKTRKSPSAKRAAIAKKALKKRANKPAQKAAPKKTKQKIVKKTRGRTKA